MPPFFSPPRSVVGQPAPRGMGEDARARVPPQGCQAGGGGARYHCSQVPEIPAGCDNPGGGTECPL